MVKKSSKSSPSPLNFEQSLAELEKLVEEMEHGDLNLEQSLKDYERGIQLTRACQEALQQAEQKVAMLESGSDTLLPFESADDSDE